MRTVYRYELIQGAQSHLLPRDAVPAYVAMRQNTPNMWCICYTDSPLVLRRFMVCRAGDEVPAYALYVGAFQQGTTAYFVLEIPA